MAYPRGKLQTNREKAKEYLKFNSENLRKLNYAQVETYWNSFREMKCIKCMNHSLKSLLEIAEYLSKRFNNTCSVQ